MDPYRRQFLACDQSVRRHLETGEAAVAVGRCTDITEFGGVDTGGEGRHYVMITNRKIRWVPDRDPSFETSLDFDDITGYEERTSKHRYAILLKHPSVEHPRRWPARQMSTETADILRGQGKLRDGVEPVTFTELAFSRRDTAVARALRDALWSRSVR